jgi:hypothetical protein
MALEEKLLRQCLERFAGTVPKDNPAKSKESVTGLKFTKLAWPQKAGLSLFDYVCDVDFGGEHIEGRGTDPVENKAIIKALGEALERICLRAAGLESQTSSGWAVHTNYQSAALNAQNELLERHYVIGSHLTRESWNDVSTSAKRESQLIYDLAAFLAREKIDLHCYVSEFDDRAQLAVISDAHESARFGIYIGSAYGEAGQVRDQAALEAARAGAHIARILARLQGCYTDSTELASEPRSKEQTVIPQLSLSEFLSARKWTTACHDRLALHASSRPFYDYIWNKGNGRTGGTCSNGRKLTSPRPRANSLESGERDFDYNELVSSVCLESMDLPEPLAGLPLVCVRATSSLLQPYFVGPTRPHNVNWAALRRLGFDDQSKLNTFPHPLG